MPATRSEGSMAPDGPTVDLTSAIFARDLDAGTLQLWLADLPDLCPRLSASFDGGGGRLSDGGVTFVALQLYGDECADYQIVEDLNLSPEATARYVTQDDSVLSFGPLSPGTVTLSAVSQTEIDGTYAVQFGVYPTDPDAGFVIGTFVAVPCNVLP